jgi:putative ABC transport system substrate-binding protein
VKRRTFIAGLGGAAAWPVLALAQQPAMPVIGFLGSASPAPFARMTASFRQGLKESGFVEGQNSAIEYRWAEGQYDRLPSLAAELVERRSGGDPREWWRCPDPRSESSHNDDPHRVYHRL